MGENIQEKGLFEILEEANPDYELQINSASYNYEQSCSSNDDEYNFDFSVQDMFLDHFFP